MVRGTNLKSSKFWQAVVAAGAIALILCVAPAQAEERDGELTLLRGAAADGDSAAQFTLANHYYRGLGVQQDFEKALALYAQAADQGLAAAENRLGIMRSEEHTSELQSLAYLVCRLLLEKKKS